MHIVEEKCLKYLLLRSIEQFIERMVALGKFSCHMSYSSGKICQQFLVSIALEGKYRMQLRLFSLLNYLLFTESLSLSPFLLHLLLSLDLLTH
jgi:hypothetical protein